MDHMGIKRGKTVEYIISFMETYGYAAMFIAMVLENANIPIPSEIVLGFAGYLIAQGVFDMHTTMVVGTLAGIVGSVLSYWMGEYGGRPLLLKYGKYVFFNEHKFELAEKMFNKYGGAAVFFGRLLPGVSYLHFFPSRYGALSNVALHYLDSSWYDSLDDFCSFYLGKILGENWQDLIEYNHEFLIVMVVVFVIIAAVLGFKYYRNRR